MLNNTAREALLQANRGKTALIIDALYYAGWTAGTVFNFALAALHLEPFATPAKIIRAGLNDPLFGRQGRRSASYTLPSAGQVLQALGLPESRHSDVLSGVDFKNLSTYRMALYAALIARKPGEYSRQLLADRLGISRTTTLNYDKKTDIQVTPNYSYTRITEANLHALPIMPNKKIGNMWLEGHGAPNIKPKLAPICRPVARTWLNSGKEVYLTRQLVNTYTVKNGKYADVSAAIWQRGA